MKQVLIVAGVVALATASPTLAKPGHGNAHGNDHGVTGPIGYGAGGCPPGLAKKDPPCIPPGQAKKLYDVGHHFPQSYNQWTPYNQIPYDLRQQYRLDPYGHYIYDQNYIYQVDPTTMIVSQVLNAILH